MLSGIAGSCGQDPGPPIDPVLQQLRHWVPYRSSAGLFFLHRFEMREVDVARVLPGWGTKHVSRTPDLPAVNLDQGQAWVVARSYLGRLPSLDEWRFAVGGNIGFRFPWGNREPNPSYANTSELALRRRTRVGTFESGRDPSGQGCYDLIGNVAEWTSTPLALHPLAIESLTARFDPQRDEIRQVEQVLPLSPFLAGVVPWMPELMSTDAADPLRYCAVGFSYAESLRVREISFSPDTLMAGSYWDDQGAYPLDPRESSSLLGVRLATDPYTFLARLETHRGSPTPGDVQALAHFLLSYRMDFERAAKLRAGLHRDLLGLDPPSPLALEAWRLLGIDR